MRIYPPEFLDAMAGFGLVPTAETPPAVVRDALNDLYRHQLRALRDRLRAGAVEKSAYLDMVVALRKHYWLLTLQLPAWERICAVTVSASPPEEGVEATVSMARETFGLMLRGEAVPSGARPTVRGDLRVVELVRAWMDRAQRGG